MDRPIPRNIDENICSIPLAIAIFLSISALVALCAKHARKALRCYTPTTSSGMVARQSPKLLITIIRDKNAPLDNREMASKESDADGILGSDTSGDGLWQKAILMGEKCQPPNFSGVIYYDYNGNRVSELPRSPRASPLPRFYLPKEEDSH